MSEPIIGSIGVAIVPNAERFWEEFKAKTAAGAEHAAPVVPVRADTREFEARIATLRAQVAATSASMHVKADTKDAQFQMHLLRDAIIGIGPAAVPVAGVLGGAFVGLLPTVATLALGIKGISDEFKSGELAASSFGGTLKTLQTESQTLKTTAANGLLGGVQQAVATAQPLFAELNGDIGVMSAQLGQIVAGAAPALLSILTQLNPLFVTLGQAVANGAAHLEHFAQTSTGVSSFVTYVQAELPQVLHVLGELVTTVSHLAQAFAPLGGGVLTIIGGLASAINAIPINVLQVMVPLLVAGYAAFRAYSAVTAIVTGVRAAIAGLGVAFGAEAAEAAAAAAATTGVAAASAAAGAAIAGAGEEAAVGWAGLLGPIAAVGVGIGLLVATFGHSTKAAQDAAVAADSYAQSVKISTDALSQANIAQTNDNLAKANAFKALDDLHAKNLATGVSYGQLTAAINSNGAALGDVFATLTNVVKQDPFSKTGQAAQKLLGVLAQYRTGLSDAIQTQNDLNVSMEQSIGISSQQAIAGAKLYGLVGTDGVNAYLQATQAAQKSTDQARQQTLQWQLESDAADLLKQAIDNLNGKNLDYATTLNSFQQSLVGVQQGAAGTANAVKGLSQEAIQNRGNLLQGVQAAEQAANAYAQQTGSTEAGRKKLVEFRKQLIDNAVAAGENRTEVTKFIDSVLKIPAKVPPTKVEIDEAAKKVAEAKLAAFQKSVDTVHGKVVAVSATVNDNGLTTFAATIERLSATAGVTVSYGRQGVTHVQKAEGGYISGPGTGTSDSIPAMLSNGEYVINAAQTAKHIDLLHAINKGVQGFAGGGPVGGDIVTLTPTKASTAAAKAAAAKTDSLSISAGGGAAYAIAEVLRSNIPAVRQATADLSKAVNEAFQLKGVQAKIAAVQAHLKQLQQDSNSLRSTVQGALSQVDVSKYADVGGLLDALGNQTGANDKFTGELNKLAKEGVNKTLLGKLAAAGPSAGLDTLAGASMSQIRQVNAAFGSYITSANTGGNYAASDVYGSQIAADQKLVTSLGAQAKGLTNNIDKLVSVVAKMSGRPVQVNLDGKALATAVFKSKEFDGVLDAISHHLVYR